MEKPCRRSYEVAKLIIGVGHNIPEPREDLCVCPTDHCLTGNEGTQNKKTAGTMLYLAAGMVI